MVDDPRDSMIINSAIVQKMMESGQSPNELLSCQRCAGCSPRDCVIVSEGANSDMEGQLCKITSRHRISTLEPFKAIMGVGLGFAIAFIFVHPKRRTICGKEITAFGLVEWNTKRLCAGYNLNITSFTRQQ